MSCSTKLPKTILSISSVGVVEGRTPAVVGVSWAQSDSAVFVPCAVKIPLGTRRWQKIRPIYPKVIRFIRELTLRIGTIELVLVDITKTNRISMLGVALAHFIAGASRCRNLRFIAPSKWLAGMLGPEAKLVIESDSLNVDIIELVYIEYPHLCEVATSPQVARAVGLMHYGFHRFCRE